MINVGTLICGSRSTYSTSFRLPSITNSPPEPHISRYMPGVLHLRRPARAALVDEHQPVAAHQRQQVRQEIIVRRAGSAVDDPQRATAPHRRVVEEGAVAVHKTFLDGEQVWGRSLGGRN